MLALSAAWMDDHGASLLAVPEVVPLRPEVAARALDLAAATKASQSSPDLAALALEGIQVDNRHDNAIRAIWWGYTAFAALVRARGGPTAEADAMTVEQERNARVPDGLSATQGTFLAEAGAAMRAGRTTSSDDRAKLAEMKLGTGHLEEALDLWLANGARLGEIERARAKLGASSAPGVLVARNRWVTVIGTILSNLDISSAEKKAVDALREPVLEAAAKAATRSAAPASQQG